MDFTVGYEPSQDEVARALLQGVKRQNRVLFHALTAVLAICGLVCVLIGAMAAGIAILLGAAVFPLALSWSLRHTGGRRLAFICVPTTLHLTSDGYTVQTDQSISTTQWALFSQVVTTPEFWLFFVNKQFTGFLPRSAFTIEQQAELDAFFAARQNSAVS